jgi:hypothetical protein
MSFFENCKSQSDVETVVNYLMGKYKISDEYSHLSYAEIANHLQNSAHDTNYKLHDALNIDKRDRTAEDRKYCFISDCLDNNSLSEITDAFFKKEADATDIKEYGLADDEDWHEAIKLTFESMLNDEIADDLFEAEDLWYKLPD